MRQLTNPEKVKATEANNQPELWVKQHSFHALVKLRPHNEGQRIELDEPQKLGVRVQLGVQPGSSEHSPESR